MKKLLLLLVLVAMLVALPACKDDDPVTPTPEEKQGEEEQDQVKVLTYAEYLAAEVDSVVTIEGYVQDKQSWWDNKATVYLQDKDGAYFIYEMTCAEADYAKLTTGTKIRVTGTRANWSGEEEIGSGATFEIIAGDTWTATAKDVTDKLGTDDMIKYQNQLVAFKDLKIVASKDGEGNEVAYLYKWNGTGSDGDDLYFNVSDGKNTYSFTVESYLRGKDSDVYKAIKELKIGDVVNLEGYAYWYNGLNPHIIACEKVAMSYAEYIATEVDTIVTIEGYVQAKQSWWDNKATVYLQDEDGAYFIYNMACTEADYAKLTNGTKIRVKGTRASWSGEEEIGEGATFEIIEGKTWTATAKDVTDKLGTEEMINYQNQLVAFKGLTIVASKDGDDKEVAYLYKWNGSGSDGDDLYFNVSDGNKTYTFTVESYLCDKNSDVYKAVKELQIGDVVNLEGFAYWYNGLNPHITVCEKVAK